MNKYRKFSLPYLAWMIMFTIIPLVMMVLFAFSNIEAFSAYTFTFKDYSFSVAHFSYVFSWSFILVFIRSFGYALASSILCLLIGYPIAYAISRMKSKYKFLLLLLFILPMWTNVLLRVQTLNNIFKPNSFLSNTFGISIDLTDYKALKVIISMTIVYLPFMIFPIYTVLEKVDKAIYEASSDLGASPIGTFFKVTLPNSVKGIFSGMTMVFLPAAMGFTIPQIMTDGDPNYIMIGQVIEREFMSSYPMFNVGSLMSLIILIFTLTALYLISRVDETGETLL